MLDAGCWMLDAVKGDGDGGSSTKVFGSCELPSTVVQPHYRRQL